MKPINSRIQSLGPVVGSPSWEARWKKKFGEKAMKPLRPVQLQAMSEAMASLEEWLPVNYPAIEVQTLAQAAASGTIDLPPIPNPDLSAFLDPTAWGTFEKPLKVDASELMTKWRKGLDAQAMAYATTMRVTGSKPNVMNLDDAPRPEPEPRVQSSYLDSIYEPEMMQKTIARLVEDMTPHLADFDCIVFRGSSGSAVGYTLGYLLKKPVAFVRKSAEGSHSWKKVEGYYGAKRIAIVDDFIASGETIRITYQEVVDAYATNGYGKPVLAHLFLYAERGSSSEGSIRGTVGEIVADSEIHLAYDPSMY